MSDYQQRIINELSVMLPPKDAYDTDDYKNGYAEIENVISELQSSAGTADFDAKLQTAYQGVSGFAKKYPNPEELNPPEAASGHQPSPWNAKNMAYDVVDAAGGIVGAVRNTLSRKRGQNTGEPEVETAAAPQGTNAGTGSRSARNISEEMNQRIGKARIASNKTLGVYDLLDDTNSFDLQSAYEDYKNNRKKTDLGKRKKEALILGAVAVVAFATITGGAGTAIALTAFWTFVVREGKRANKRRNDFALNKDMLDKAALAAGVKDYKAGKEEQPEKKQPEKRPNLPAQQTPWSIYNNQVPTPGAQNSGQANDDQQAGPDLSRPSAVNGSQTLQVLVGENLNADLENRKNKYLEKRASADATKSKIANSAVIVGTLGAAASLIGATVNLVGSTASKPVLPEFKQFVSDLISQPGNAFVNSAYPAIFLGALALSAYVYNMVKPSAKSSQKNALDSLSGVSFVQEQTKLLQEGKSPTVNPVEPMPPVQRQPRPAV